MRFIKQILLLLFISLGVTGCRQEIVSGNSGFSLQAGDLLFQDLDSGPLCDAIEKVTTGYEGANFSHVGIVIIDDSGNFAVIEAVSSGVKVTELEEFLGRSSDAKCRPKVVAGRLKKPYRHLIPYAIKEAFVLRGKPYDKVFAVDNDAYYCSELVYEIFRRANDNKAVFTLQPMTFKDPDTGKILAEWEKYFSELGAAVPESRPGINPGGISCSPALKIIYAYGNPDRNLKSKWKR